MMPVHINFQTLSGQLQINHLITEFVPDDLREQHEKLLVEITKGVESMTKKPDFDRLNSVESINKFNAGRKNGLFQVYIAAIEAIDSLEQIRTSVKEPIESAIDEVKAERDQLVERFDSMVESAFGDESEALSVDTSRIPGVLPLNQRLATLRSAADSTRHANSDRIQLKAELSNRLETMQRKMIPRAVA